VEDDVNVWCCAILELHARNDDDEIFLFLSLSQILSLSGWQNQPIARKCTYYVLRSTQPPSLSEMGNE